MKTYKIITCVFLFTSMFTQACQKDDETQGNPTLVPPEEEVPSSEFNYIYNQGTDGFELYRIPAIVKSKSNTLLAFAEARKARSNGDSGDIDLVVKRSSDNGKTWSKQITIWNDGQNTCGNPVPIVDDRGRIHLLMTWNFQTDKWGAITNGTGEDSRRPYYTYSDDDGITWAQPVEITSSVKKEKWDWYATGPCHGIQIQKGIHKGRLVAPNYFTTRESGKVTSYSHIIYSDDYGKTWKPGEPTPVGGVGECSVAEIGEGTLMLNMRADEGFYRKSCTSIDGGLTWSSPQISIDQIDCKCQGSILSIGGAVFLSNAASATERINMTIKKSTDNGKNWKGQYTVYEGNSGYSDIVELSDSQIAIIYEGGEKRYTDGLAFKVVSIKSIQ
ncbi:sialidase family protein [Bacteroides xylanisolvens]|uniref:sialidase family protein n=1 Tax=Bacteroides xylanisolvens TaxID=371601 RepID=UPI002306E2AF|nr:sialidase family protein [Bacteroides xylanisolvens]MDB0717614.1 sialidase family protein [Bacteroides xylanisolvens]MDB0738966.1 sialidase family protein [Bacteroides xylanisolvens]